MTITIFTYFQHESGESTNKNLKRLLTKIFFSPQQQTLTKVKISPKISVTQNLGREKVYICTWSPQKILLQKHKLT